MKTINEAAKEYAIKEICLKIEFASSSKEEIELCIRDFTAGVQFAEEWISVEDELPPIIAGDVSEENILLLKNKEKGITLGWRRPYGYHTQLGVFNEVTITHWRPINKK